ncbi:ATP-binding protein [Nocardioides terrisoli]|uniref:ATP-binding protein n=1 Tax=Nocardioides terrisoli TaxID=3388267 RepID=UPI00287BB86B|nr:ATP-binding protein [Nocardioides marmorisolisilvae]
MRRRARAVFGRGIDELLRDSGAPVPARTAAPPALEEDRLFDQHVGAHGHRARAAGWAPALAPFSTWRMTSEQTPVLWPLIAAQGLPPTGAQIGIDLLSGGAFYCDPLGWVKDDSIPVTNPNIFVFGKPGRGKSGTVKIFCLRMMDFGYRVLILGDTKDEYEPLCHALDVEPFSIGHGLPARVNPLDIGPLGNGWARLDAAEATRRASLVFNRWLLLIRGLVGSQKIGADSVPFGPSDETAVSAALRALTGYTRGATELAPVTVPELWAALDDPTGELVDECRFASVRHFQGETRTLRDALGALVKGHLEGLFDAPTSIRPDWRAPVQSLSLSRLEKSGDEAVGIALLCLNSWGQGMREIAEPGDVRIVVRDETWKQMRLGLEPVKTLDSNLRLSRHAGDVQVVVYHKPSDPLSAGAAGSQAVAIAKDLLHLADIRVLHGQDKAVVDELAALLGLNPIAQQLVTGWAMGGKGRALWTVGERQFKVEAKMTPLELDLTYTNDALQIV